MGFVYCISDVHGEYDRYLAMLEKIRFSSEDTLYVLGDVIGHTPTVYLAGDTGEPFRIWHGTGMIDIDCGCGNETPLRRLACLRLNDMMEFYV